MTLFSNRSHSASSYPLNTSNLEMLSTSLFVYEDEQCQKSSMISVIRGGNSVLLLSVFSNALEILVIITSVRKQFRCITLRFSMYIRYIWVSVESQSGKQRFLCDNKLPTWATSRS